MSTHGQYESPPPSKSIYLLHIYAFSSVIDIVLEYGCSLLCYGWLTAVATGLCDSRKTELVNASNVSRSTQIHKTRNPRPFTGFFFGLYMHPNRLLDLKIVFNQHPKPPNGITNVFCIGGRSGPVNFLFPFRWPRDDPPESGETRKFGYGIFFLLNAGVYFLFFWF